MEIIFRVVSIVHDYLRNSSPEVAVNFLLWGFSLLPNTYPRQSGFLSVPRVIMGPSLQWSLFPTQSQFLFDYKQRTCLEPICLLTWSSAIRGSIYLSLNALDLIPPDGLTQVIPSLLR